jgi:hypothetical protein
MASKRGRLKGLTRAIGFFSGTVLLGAFMCAGTASAQCGPTGSVNAKNTACGTNALVSVTSGKSDTAFGHYALDLTTFGSYNTATGADALRDNSSGGANTAIGAQALLNNTSAMANTAIGYRALWQNTTGPNNTAFSGNSSAPPTGDIGDTGEGGAIFNEGRNPPVPTVKITNSTFFGNVGLGSGGAIDNEGALTVTNSTFSGNVAGGGVGGDILGSASLKNTNLAGSAGGNCYGTITDAGYNISDDTSCGFTKTGSCA